MSAVLTLYACAQTVPSEHDYALSVVERFGLDASRQWEARGQAARLADPRVCSFCDGYERARRRVLGMEALPTAKAGLRRCAREAEEWERDSGRAWLAALDAEEEGGEIQTVIARWEYRRSVRCTDLARMLLRAAADHPGDRRPTGNRSLKGDSGSQKGSGQ